MMAKSENTAKPRSLALKLMLTCGVVAPLLFIVVFLIEGALRPGYSALRQPVSSLSIGADGWTQSANFIFCGALIVISALGLRMALRSPTRSLWGPLLIGLVGIGLIGAGIFTADPFNGYPPGTPLVPVERTQHGIYHDLFGVPVFFGLPIACFVFTRLFFRVGQRGWAAYSLLSGIGILIAFVLTSMGLSQTPGLVDVAGVFQRLTIGIGFVWIALIALHWLRKALLA